jgi:hypothetical protein
MSGLGSPAMRLLDIMGMLNALLFALLPFFMARPWWREKSLLPAGFRQARRAGYMFGLGRASTIMSDAPRIRHRWRITDSGHLSYELRYRELRP